MTATERMEPNDEDEAGAEVPELLAWVSPNMREGAQPGVEGRERGGIPESLYLKDTEGKKGHSQSNLRGDSRALGARK